MLSIEQGLQRVQQGEVPAAGSSSMTQQEHQQQEQLLDLLRQQGGISGQQPARMLDDKYLSKMKLNGLKVSSKQVYLLSVLCLSRKHCMQ
jgi:hypothetical protein